MLKEFYYCAKCQWYFCLKCYFKEYVITKDAIKNHLRLKFKNSNVDLDSDDENGKLN